MQSVAVFVALFALASAANVQFAVQHPATSVVSQRLGGNFAYTVNQGAVGYPGYGSPVVYTAGAVPAVQTVGATQYAYATPTQYVHKSVNTVPVTYGNYGTVPVSTVVAGTPANTYRTVAGVSPIAYNGYNGYNGIVGNQYGAYPYGTYGAYPYGTYGSLGQVVY